MTTEDKRDLINLAIKISDRKVNNFTNRCFFFYFFVVFYIYADIFPDTVIRSVYELTASGAFPPTDPVPGEDIIRNYASHTEDER